MRRRTFLTLFAGIPTLGALGYLITPESWAQGSGDQATVAALQTQVSVLQTKVALETQVAGLQTQVAGNSSSSPASTAIAGTGTVLYDASGSELEKWPTPTGWKYLRGMLLYDGSGNGESTNTATPTVLLSPRQPRAREDYAVEAEIQVVSGQSGCGHFGFGVLVRRSGDTGYSAGVGYDCAGQPHADIWTGVQHGQALGEASFDPGHAWHTYRLEVQGAQINFLIDSNPALQTADNRYISPGDTGLFAGPNVQLNVRRFRVLTL